MTLQSSMVGFVGYVTVGFGGDISAQYPVMRITEEHARNASDQVNDATTRRVVWRIESLAVAASLAAVPALCETLQTQLARRGSRVTVVELGGDARILPAGGVSSGSARGWPRVTVQLRPDKSVGVVQAFELVAETEVPIVTSTDSGFDIVEHLVTETTENDDGATTRRVVGRLRVANTQQALAYVELFIWPTVDQLAESGGLRAVRRITQGPDLSACEYEWSLRTRSGDAGGTFGPGISEAEVVDRTDQAREGRRQRTVSGFAVGTGATGFANAQRPGGLAYIQRASVSAPRQPDGRVDFTYEALDGVENAMFPGAKIFSFQQSIARAGGGRDTEATAYYSADPVLYKGVKRPVTVVQRTTVEFTGSFDSVVVQPLMSAAALVRVATLEKSSQAGLKRLSVAHEFIFTDEPAALPNPIEVFAP